MTDYHPLSCDLHDELEVAAMRGKPVRLHWRELDGTTKEASGVVLDIEVDKGEEFLVFAMGNDRLRLRPDQLELDTFPVRYV